MLWVDKYRPKNLQQISCLPQVTSRLSSLSKNSPTMPHLLFYGPSGAGKKTRIMCLLRAIFGPGAERLRLDKRVFTNPSKKSIEVNMISSNYHIEISPGDAGLNDRYVVQEVIKEMAQNKSLVSAGSNTFNIQSRKEGVSTSTKSSKKAEFKVVLLVDVDRLSRPAQAALRRTMEKYASTCRLILCCENPSKVIDPVRSRCLGIRVPAPSHDEVGYNLYCLLFIECTKMITRLYELSDFILPIHNQIVSILQSVARKESITLSSELALTIAQSSNRNLRRAILMLESYHVQNRDCFAIQSASKAQLPPVQRTDWEIYITQLANDITKEQSPQRLLAAREKLYELLVNCIPANVIIKTLAVELCKNLDDELKHQVIEWAAFYEHRISMGSKDIFHLEAFIAKYMAIYKQYLNALFA